ncbi:hypothetical protein ACERK3_14295 [Phycisphaerales bacterium AB-hyl4]|uniref:ATP-grasp domain-containing protein n=1 Tax=Natronomicrosphaera hydrolytica TaxID=3242702 RepID=A0ABV4U8L3_9BACT
MICYFVCSQHQYTIGHFLAGWGEVMADRVAVVPYESLVGRPTIPAASCYIFSDVERLTPTRLAVAIRIREHLEAANVGAKTSDAPRLLNHPVRTCRRYELLKMLHEKGVNDFRVHRLDESPESWRYPVFLRIENDHGGSRTQLLHDPPAVQQAMADLRQAGVRLDEVIATEFCDTSVESGIHRKYGAFVVGRQIIPRHLMFGSQWMLKEPELWDDQLRDEQRTYLETNPHAAALREICADAGVDYGRVDYGIVDGQVRVWEINTNPLIQQQVYQTQRDPYTHELFSDRIRKAFEELAAGPVPKDLPKLRLNASLAARIFCERASGWGRRRARTLLNAMRGQA